MNEIYLLTGYDGFYGQTRKPWVSIDTPKFVKELQSFGYIVHVHEFHDVACGKVDIRECIVLYSFSHRANLQHYIRDCLQYLQKQGNTLLPSLDLFACHENKGWQELFRLQYGLADLNSYYFSSKRELAKHHIQYPMVFKTLTGSNSTGVSLVHSEADVIQQLKKHEPKLKLGQKLDFWRRKYLRKAKTFPGYPNYDLTKDYYEFRDYMTPEIPFVLQQFIPGLSYDYRVIVIGERYYLSKRMTKEGDFRASGAKLFTFDIPNPDPVLDYAKVMYEKVKTPYLSIDLGEDASGKLYLFEFQASHFGINAIVRGKGFFCFQDGKWNFCARNQSFEQDLALGLNYFLTH